MPVDPLLLPVSNDRNLLLRSGHQESKNSQNSHRSARRREPQAGAGQANEPALLRFEWTICDNGLLCQPEVGFQAELGVASILKKARILKLGSYDTLERKCLSKRLISRVTSRSKSSGEEVIHIPRGLRLDTPGVLHHVMTRGLERQQIIRDHIVSELQRKT